MIIIGQCSCCDRRLRGRDNVLASSSLLPVTHYIASSTGWAILHMIITCWPSPSPLLTTSNAHSSPPHTSSHALDIICSPRVPAQRQGQPARRKNLRGANAGGRSHICDRGGRYRGCRVNSCRCWRWYWIARLDFEPWRSGAAAVATDAYHVAICELQPANRSSKRWRSPLLRNISPGI